MADNTAPTEIPQLPEDATPEQKDLHWYKHVYQGDKMPQLTLRAVLMGGVLGMLMSAANLYTTLSIGWAFGIAITACVLSFVIWNLIRFLSGTLLAVIVLGISLVTIVAGAAALAISDKLTWPGAAGIGAGGVLFILAAYALMRRKLSNMSILENACMASTASAAGYSTGSTIATMFGALVLLYEIPEGKTAAEIYTWDVTAPWVVVIFTLCTGLMGVFLAIPMKRQQINHEQLPFPSGTAAAETLRSLYSASREAVQKAYVLVVGLGAGLLIGFLRVGEDVLDAVGFLKRLFEKIFFLRIPTEIEMHFLGRLYPGGRQPNGFAFEPSALLIAAGMIVGMRISLSLVLSSLLLYGVVAPQLAKVDAAHMEQGAKVVMTAAEAAAVGNTDPDTAATAAVSAVVKAAADLGIKGDAVQTAAHRAAAGAIEAAKADTDPSRAISNVGKAIGAAAAPVAASGYANRDAAAAATEARAAAITAGKTPDEADHEYTRVFDEKKYKPNFIWNWGGNAIVITRWSLWGGTAVMVFSSLMSVALQWKTIVRAFMGVKGGGKDSEHLAGMQKIEVPGLWMVIGMLPITIAMVWLQIQAFGVSWYAGVIAVAMSFVLSLVASRATGETDTTPIGAMGKVMQLLFAVLAPKNIAANLASAGIAANSASSSADLLTDLKTGYLLGANPRRQFLAQFFGVFFGTIAIVPIWYLMVPTREKLESFALPSTRAWEAVARVLVKGVGELPQSAVWAILIGAAVGIILPVIERVLPPKARKFMPSATGVGLAWVMPFQNTFSFFVGAAIAMLWTKVSRKSAEHYNVPVASGLIAGESLMAAGLAITATVVGIGKMKGWW